MKSPPSAWRVSTAVSPTCSCSIIATPRSLRGLPIWGCGRSSPHADDRRRHIAPPGGNGADGIAAMTITLMPVPGLPAVQPGDDLPALLLNALADSALPLVSGDIVVICQKVVSKAEGRIARLSEI